MSVAEQGMPSSCLSLRSILVVKDETFAETRRHCHVSLIIQRLISILINGVSDMDSSWWQHSEKDICHSFQKTMTSSRQRLVYSDSLACAK